MEHLYLKQQDRGRLPEHSRRPSSAYSPTERQRRIRSKAHTPEAPHSGLPAQGTVIQAGSLHLLRQSQAPRYSHARILISLKKTLRHFTSCLFHYEERLCDRAPSDLPISKHTGSLQSTRLCFRFENREATLHRHKKTLPYRRQIRAGSMPVPLSRKYRRPVAKATGRQKLYIDRIQAILPAMKPRNLFTELCLERNERTGLRLTPSLLISSSMA